MCGPETSLNNYESDFMQPEHSVTNTHKEAMGMTHGQCACPEKKNQQDARAATIAYQVLPGSHASSMLHPMSCSNTGQDCDKLQLPYTAKRTRDISERPACGVTMRSAFIGVY